MTSSDIQFTRLSQIQTGDITAHMSDPRMAEHMPLLGPEWSDEMTVAFVAKKEKHWEDEGLGHWAFLYEDTYVGWGGLEKIGDEWDFGLVLKPEAFGLGVKIARKIIEFAHEDARIKSIIFLLPPTRKNLGALKRLGAVFEENIIYDAAEFRKYRLMTPKNFQ